MNTFNIGGVRVTVTREPVRPGNNDQAAAAAIAREIVDLLTFATGGTGETPSGPAMWLAMETARKLAESLRARLSAYPT